MSLTETMGKELIQSMTKEERQHFADTLMAEFLRAMPREERKEMLYSILPKLIDETLHGMTLEEKKHVIESVVDLMKSNIANEKHKE